jgi:myo-inositol-1(or 4)-monophosphatase
MLETAVEAAHEAGRLIAERYPALHTIKVKGYRDIATEVDTAAEAIVMDMIRRRFPDHDILSEEAGGSGIGSGYTWIIDPVDGTTNYAHRLPIFTVSIGVVKAGQPVAGVIHDPMRSQTFTAERGKGAWVDGERLSASGVDRLEHSVVGVDWGHSDEIRARTFDMLSRVAPRVGTVRALGSAALALAYVAAGWMDAYYNFMMKPWDVAAGVLLIAEAGGHCTTLDGSPYSVEEPACLATNGKIHGELVEVMREA